MSWSFTPLSRDELLGLPEKRRKSAISTAVDEVSSQVIMAATEGKTCCIVDINSFQRDQSGIRSRPARYIPNTSDMMEGLQAKFPNCKIEYTEVWEDVRPGVRQQKKGVLVDWS